MPGSGVRYGCLPADPTWELDLTRLRLATAAAVLSTLGTLTAADPITARVRTDLEFLAGPECEGRGPKTAGIHKAADYIAEQFRAAGLRPVEPSSSNRSKMRRTISAPSGSISSLPRSSGFER